MKPTGGAAPVDIKRVLPVDRNTNEVRPTFALGEALVEQRRQSVEDRMTRLRQFIGEEEKSLVSVAAHLRSEMGEEAYQLSLRRVGGRGSLSDAVRLFDDLQLTGRGQYVRRNQS